VQDDTVVCRVEAAVCVEVHAAQGVVLGCLEVVGDVVALGKDITRPVGDGDGAACSAGGEMGGNEVNRSCTQALFILFAALFIGVNQR